MQEILKEVDLKNKVKIKKFLTLFKSNDISIKRLAARFKLDRDLINRRTHGSFNYTVSNWGDFFKKTPPLFWITRSTLIGR